MHASTGFHSQVISLKMGVVVGRQNEKSTHTAFSEFLF